jgi:hypothetical protein
MVGSVSIARTLKTTNPDLSDTLMDASRATLKELLNISARRPSRLKDFKQSG